MRWLFKSKSLSDFQKVMNTVKEGSLTSEHLLLLSFDQRFEVLFEALKTYPLDKIKSLCQYDSEIFYYRPRSSLVKSFGHACVEAKRMDVLKWVIEDKLSFWEVKKQGILNYMIFHGFFKEVTYYASKMYECAPIWMEEDRILSRLNKPFFNEMIIKLLERSSSFKEETLFLLEKNGFSKEVHESLKNMNIPEVEDLSVICNQGAGFLLYKGQYAFHPWGYYLRFNTKKEEVNHNLIKEKLYNHRPTIKYFYNNFFISGEGKLLIANISLFKFLSFLWERPALNIDVNYLHSFLSKESLKESNINLLTKQNDLSWCLNKLSSKELFSFFKKINDCEDHKILVDTLDYVKGHPRWFTPQMLLFSSLEEIHNKLVEASNLYYERRQHYLANEQEALRSSRGDKFDFKEFIIPNLPSFHGAKVGEYQIFVPSKTKDLMDAGLALNICVGGAQYERYMAKKKAAIFMLTKDGQFSHCVEIRKNMYHFYFEQAVGHRNIHMDSSLKKALVKTLKI